MNKEIAEILSLLNSTSWSQESKILEDYINKLFEETITLHSDMEKLIDVQSENWKLEKENQRLKKINSELIKNNKDLFLKLKQKESDE